MNQQRSTLRKFFWRFTSRRSVLQRTISKSESKSLHDDTLRDDTDTERLRHQDLLAICQRVAAGDDPSLITLDLSKHDISSEGAQLLEEALQTNENLCMLNLNGNQLGALGAEAIVRGLQYHESMEYLFLAKNRISEIQTLSILISNVPLLKWLDLSDNDINQDAADSLFRGLNGHSCLEMLDLSLNNMSRLGSLTEEHVSSHKSKVDRSLHDTRGDSSTSPVTYLGQTLQNTPMLLELNLFGNPLGNLGAFAVSNVDFGPLQKLNLGYNNVDDSGAIALAKAIRRCYTQAQSATKLTPIANEKQTKSIKEEKTHLRELILTGNQITQVGAGKLVLMSMPPTNTTRSKRSGTLSSVAMERLDLSLNKLTEKGRGQLRSMSPPTLVLVLEGSSTGGGGWR